MNHENHHHENHQHQPSFSTMKHHDTGLKSYPYAVHHLLEVIFRVISPSATSRISATLSTGKRPGSRDSHLFNMGMNQKITVVSTL
jgi:hypothetical protein